MIESNDNLIVQRPSTERFFLKYPMLIVLGMAAIIADMGYSSMIPLVPIYFREFFFVQRAVIIGYAVSAYAVSETALKPLSGWLGDRVERLYLVLGGFCISSITPILMSRVGHPGWFILLRFIDGIAAALLWPSLVGLFADCTEEKDRATAMSIFSTSILVGLGIGPSVGSYIRGLTGSFHDVFFFVSGVMATGFVAVLISRPYLKKYFERSGLPDKRMRAHKQHAFYPFSREIWSKKFIVLVMLAFLQMGATSMLTPIVVLYGRIDLNLSMVVIGHMFLGAAVIVGMLAIPAGRLVDRIGKEKSLKLGFAFGVAGMCIAVTEKRMELLLIGIMLYGIGFVIGAPAWLSLVTHGRWSQYRGSILGIITSFQGIGVIVGPVVGTYVWDHIGHTAPFLLCGVFLAVCFVASLIWLRESG